MVIAIFKQNVGIKRYNKYPTDFIVFIRKKLKKPRLIIATSQPIVIKFRK